jgi:hypothetical protein
VTISAGSAGPRRARRGWACRPRPGCRPRARRGHRPCGARGRDGRLCLPARAAHLPGARHRGSDPRWTAAEGAEAGRDAGEWARSMGGAAMRLGVRSKLCVVLLTQQVAAPHLAPADSDTLVRVRPWRCSRSSSSALNSRPVRRHRRPAGASRPAAPDSERADGWRKRRCRECPPSGTHRQPPGSVLSSCPVSPP